MTGKSAAVTRQLRKDYPDGTPWVAQMTRWEGPVSVPVSQIDMREGDTKWSLAANDAKSIRAHLPGVRSGRYHPVVLIRAPGHSKLWCVDGHTRIILCRRLGKPVRAWIGISTSAHGPWDEKRPSRHEMSNAALESGTAVPTGNGSALDLSAQTPSASTVPHPFGKPGGPGLWRVKGMQLDPYVQNVAHALLRTGQASSRSQAIRMAWGIIRDWASGRMSNSSRKVTPAVQAAARKAVAAMARKQSVAHAMSNEIDLAFPGVPFFMRGPWDEVKHPRQWHGHFAPKGNPSPPRPVDRKGEKIGSANVRDFGTNRPLDPEDRHLLSLARIYRNQARAMLARADLLDRTAARMLRMKSASPVPRRGGSAVTPASSLAAQRGAATRMARGTVPFRQNNRFTSGGLPPGRIRAQAASLRSAARALDHKATHLVRLAGDPVALSNQGDTFAPKSAEGNQMDLASPTSTAGRTALAEKGQALPDKSFPIPDVAFLKKAMRAYGRAPAAKRPALRALIRRSARRLGATGLLKNPVWGMSGQDAGLVLSLAVPAASSGDGPRLVKVMTQTGLQPHQVRTYARLRKRGHSHASSVRFAKRIKSRANQMGTASSGIPGGKADSRVSNTGGMKSRSYSNETVLAAVDGGGQSPRTARGQIQPGVKAKPGAKTNQRSVFSPLLVPRTPRSGGSEGGPRGHRIVQSAVPGLRSSAATPPGGKLLRQSAGKYASWPDNKGQGKPPPTPVSTYPGKTPTNLRVNTLMDENARSIRVSAQGGRPAPQPALTGKARIAYGKLRSKGISHAAAMHVVGQYFGAGKPKNQLGLHKGGPQTNLRLRSGAGSGASTPRPKVPRRP